LPFDFHVSFEAHICGGVAGLVLAVVYRDQGPENEQEQLEDEEDEEFGQADQAPEDPPEPLASQ
jgi:hypothetical protein